MIQLHPTNPGLWVRAARWEFDEQQNPDSARVLFQRGLRLNPDAQGSNRRVHFSSRCCAALWHEFFAMEVRFIEKLRARHRVLGFRVRHCVWECVSVCDRFIRLMSGAEA